MTQKLKRDFTNSHSLYVETDGKNQSLESFQHTYVVVKYEWAIQIKASHLNDMMTNEPRSPGDEDSLPALILSPEAGAG